jgi:uncharacterized Tic20 family protein
MSENPYQPTQPQQSPQGQYGSYNTGGYAPAAPPAYGYDATSQEANSAATLSLVFGILAVVLFPIVFGPLAVWQAKKAERLGKPATAGKVLGWIGIVMAVVAVVVLVFAFILAMVGAGSSTGF